ncbi:MAG: response regulator [bacterium]
MGEATGEAMDDVPVRFLLVEDDADHAWLVEREFDLHRDSAAFARVEDADQALAYLRGDRPFERRDLPDVMLVDLNLPRRSGVELLTLVRGEQLWRGIHTVVLTTSSAGSDARRVAELAEGFVTKPVGLLEFRRAIGEIVTHWVRVCHSR